MIVRGILALLFGIAALAWPVATLLAIIVVFAVYAIVDGIIAIVWSVSDRREGTFSWGSLLLGIVGIIAGVLALSWPGVTALAILYVIAAWAIIRGITEFAASIEHHRVLRGSSWLIAVSGVLSVIFGLLMFAWPAAGVMAMVWLIGIYAIIYAVLAFATAAALRSLTAEPPPTQAHPV